MQFGRILHVPGRHSLPGFRTKNEKKMPTQKKDLPIKKTISQIKKAASSTAQELSGHLAELKKELPTIKTPELGIKQTLAKLSHATTTAAEEVAGSFSELRLEVERRFGMRSVDEEVFRALPEPSGMDMPMLEALRARRTIRSMSNEPIPDPVLANLLFAADGINRKNGKRTTPTALNWQETEIYVLKPNGIWRWVPERRGLLFCSPDDARGEVYLIEQPTLALPPAVFVYVANLKRTRSVVTDLAEKVADRIDAASRRSIERLRSEAVFVDVGIKMQSVSLAAASMHLASSILMGFSREKLSETLHLKPLEHLVGAQAVGFPAKSLLDHIR